MNVLPGTPNFQLAIEPCCGSSCDGPVRMCLSACSWLQGSCHHALAGAAVKGLEVSPQVMTTAGALAERVAQQGGAALVVDYGRNRPYPASLQAIRQHKFCGLLEQPGLADLSAHVDFTAIR